jgi:heat-inducible transcriptional repressor
MSSRRLEILRAIVDEYVSTQEPVGSKSIADHHGLGISPATPVLVAFQQILDIEFL